jgi:DNA-binding protein H-NS
MKTLASILAQIEKLQAEAEVFRKRERASAVERIREAMVLYGITAEELTRSPPKAEDIVGLKGGALKHYTKGEPQGKSVGVASSYENFKHGTHYAVGDRVWRGHGRMPGWLIDAVDAAGDDDLSPFAVKETEKKHATV